MAEVTKDEALQLVREHAWEERTNEVTCGHPGCEDHLAKGRLMIHTYGSFGYDISLAAAEKYITEATEVRWVAHFRRHDLAIRTAEGRELCFDVPQPVEVPDAADA